MELTNEFTVGVPVDRAWAVLTDVERIAPCLPGAQLQEVEGDEYRGVVKVKVGPITAQYKGAATFVERDDEAHRAVLRAEGRDVRGAGNASATITAELTSAAEGTRVSVVTDLTVTGKVAQFGRGVLADVSAKLLDQFVACLEADVLSEAGDEADVPAGASEAAVGAEAGGSTLAAAPADGGAAGEPEGAGGDAPPAEPRVGAPAAPESSRAPATADAPKPAPAGPQPERDPEPEPVVAAGVSGNGRRAGDHSEGADSGATEIGTARQIHAPEAQPVDLLGTAGGSIARRVAPAVGLAVVLLWLLRRRRRR